MELKFSQALFAAGAFVEVWAARDRDGNNYRLHSGVNRIPQPKGLADPA